MHRQRTKGRSSGAWTHRIRSQGRNGAQKCDKDVAFTDLRMEFESPAKPGQLFVARRAEKKSDVRRGNRKQETGYGNLDSGL